MEFYVAEVVGINSRARARKVEAKTLTAAKRNAVRNQMFYGTVLYIGDAVNEDGFIVNPICVKEDGKKWEMLKR